MPPPPAKRRKRGLVLDTEDESSSVSSQHRNTRPTTASTSSTKSRLRKEEGHAALSVSTRTRTKQQTASQRPQPDSTQWSPPSSPDRSQSKPSTARKALSTGSLRAFLTAANPAPAHSRGVKREAPLPHVEETEEQDDVIEDDSPDEKKSKLLATQGTSNLVLDRRKPLQEQTQTKAVTASQDKPITASQRFLTVSKPIAKEALAATRSVPGCLDTRPWAERYGPRNLEELVVHKKKVADVQGWLESVFVGQQRKRLLILRGPSGAGKTATISALAKAMDLDLSEWRNPIDCDFASEAYVSMSAQFEDFLGRSGTFGNLDFLDDAGKTQSRMPNQSKVPIVSKHLKAILMEEFPNTFSSTSHALRSFRSSILQYLATNMPPIGHGLRQKSEDNEVIRPLIMIITETSTDATTSSSQSFTAHRLLGSDILHHPGTHIIDFNPVAPTLLTKALELVVQKEARDSGRRRIPGPLALKMLGEVGDVRSAISSLEFLCLRGDDGDDWGGRVASKSKKNNNSVLTKMEKASLAIVSQREASLGLFHAVGKVVYNKREEPHSANRPCQPPDHLPQHARLKTSEVSVDTLMDDTGTDPRTFIAALHENYVMSCESHDFTDSLNGCIDALSDSDILVSERVNRSSSARGNYQGTATESLRQDEIAFQTAVRGVLFCLPCPVKRTSHPVRGAGRIDAHKMFYPTSMRLGRQTEEIEGFVQHWSNNSIATPVLNDPSDDNIANARTHSTQAELVLERLPYIAKIHLSRSGTCLSELERITQFKGFHTSSEEPPEDDELKSDALRDKAMMPPPSVPSRTKAANMTTQPLDQNIGKLYLSDDDIEDE